MARKPARLEVSLAWWLRPYLNTLAMFCMLTQQQPDWVKLEAVIKRAIRIKVR